METPCEERIHHTPGSRAAERGHEWTVKCLWLAARSGVASCPGCHVKNRIYLERSNRTAQRSLADCATSGRSTAGSIQRSRCNRKTLRRRRGCGFKFILPEGEHRIGLNALLWSEETISWPSTFLLRTTSNRSPPVARICFKDDLLMTQTGQESSSSRWEPGPLHADCAGA